MLSGTGKVSDAIEKLEASESMLGEAMTNLGSVASMWAMISDKSIAFGNQQRLLVAAVSKVQIAKMELMAMAIEESSLQKSLWRNSELTESFAKALLAINMATAWQSRFRPDFHAGRRHGLARPMLPRRDTSSRRGSHSTMYEIIQTPFPDIKTLRLSESDTFRPCSTGTDLEKMQLHTEMECYESRALTRLRGMGVVALSSAAHIERTKANENVISEAIERVSLASWWVYRRQPVHILTMSETKQLLESVGINDPRDFFFFDWFGTF